MIFSGFRGYIVLIIILIISLLLISCEKSEDFNEKLKDESTALPAIEQGQAETFFSNEDLEPITIPLQNETMLHATPLFKAPLGTDSTTMNFVVLSYYEKGVALPKNSYNNEWLTVELGHGTTYIPTWYWTEAASETEVTAPVQLLVGGDALFHLNPNSATSWTYDQLESIREASNGTEFTDKRILSLFRSGEWYGVFFSPYPTYDEYILHRPVLLWLHASSVKSVEGSYGHLLSSKLELPMDTIREITEVLLLKGTKKEVVEQLLGEPHFIETSRNLNFSGESMRVGENWRYEHPVGHFIVTMYEDVIEEWQWSLPMTESDQGAVSSEQYPYGYHYDFRYIPLVPSIEPVIEWKNQGDIAYAYLWEGTDEVLLLRGHDGWISGMHYFSNLYAVDRKTGAKLWQIDGGHEGLFAVLSADKQYVAILTRFDSVHNNYENHLRYIDISNGEIIWEQKLEEQFYQMTGTRNEIILFIEHFSDETEGRLLVIDMETGKTNWEKSFNQSFHVLNDGLGEPYVMVQQELRLDAYHPKTGRKQWTIERDTPLTEVVISDMFFEVPLDGFNKKQNTKWVMFGNERLLIKLQSGEIETEYAIRSEEVVFAVNDQYWLIQRALDHTQSWLAEKFETVLYDIRSKRELWTRPGRGSTAILENDVLFSMWDGIPTAVNLKDGRKLWEMKPLFPFDNKGIYYADSFLLLDHYMLIPYGSNLLVMRKVDGSLEYRLKDILFGYPELHDTRQIRKINRDEHYVYVGSANGKFSKIKINEEW